MNEWYSSPSLYATLPHFSHDRSNWSSPSFSSTTFQHFPGISGLLLEVSKFQQHTKLCFSCSTLIVSCLNLSSICWWKEPFYCWMLLSVWQSMIWFHVAVTTLRKLFRYSTFSICFFIYHNTGDGCIEILITFSTPPFMDWKHRVNGLNPFACYLVTFPLLRPRLLFGIRSAHSSGGFIFCCLWF